MARDPSASLQHDRDGRDPVDRLKVRAAHAEDHAAFVRFFAELAIDDPVPDVARWTKELASDAFFVVDESDAPIGYCVARPMEGLGYVVHVVTDPAHRGKGVGLRLMEQAAARLRAAGCTEWQLNVKPDNATAIRLYERCGMRRMHASTAFEIAWSDVARLPGPAASTVSARALTPEEDARAAAACALTGGQLASARARDYVLIGAFDADAVVGLAAFNPSFPGAFPFRALRRGVARVLLDGMRPFARPEDAAVRLVAENDTALEAEVRAAGAVTKLQIEQMKGPIPLRIL